MVKASSTAPATTVKTEMKRRKKKGRPSLMDLEKQNNNKNKNNNFNNDNDNSNSKRNLTSGENYDFTPARRSTRRSPNSSNSPAFEDGGDDDDDDERKEKKVKLVVRLPQSNLKEDSQHSGSDDSDGDVDLGGEGHVSPSPKKQKTNDVDRRSNGAVPDEGGKVPKPMETKNGLHLESGPTTPLPEKKLLVFILDRLQKKDTYGVFSEPVDPDELPDYQEIIEHPMDFGTVRKKLDGGLYPNLEELEADVLLICSNAMQYNAPDTVYFRQARTIQELAKRDFANLRHEGDDGEPQPKVVRRGRPPGKNQKKSPEESPVPVDRIGPELASGATLASGEDKAVGSNSYSLRKGPVLHKIRSSDALVTLNRSRNGENYTDWSIDWSEFPASILRADMKYGKKNFTALDENKRDTYNEYHPPGFDNELMMLYNIDGDMKRLMAVGLHFERHAYARSLVTFAANLGPVAWKIASRKIESVLPAGVKFGPGWVGENETRSELLLQKSASSSSRPLTPSAPRITSPVQSRSSDEMVEAVRRLNTQSELAVQGNASSWGMQGSPFEAEQKSVLHPHRNGPNGMFGYIPSSQLGMIRPSKPSGHPSVDEGSMPHQMLGVTSRNDTSPNYPASSSRHGSIEPKILESWGVTGSEVGVPGKASYQGLSVQQRQSLPIPPDLNVRFREPFRSPGSPSSSSLPIGSPQQPDLALQL